MRALFLLLVLAGCGSGGQDQPANHGYGFAYDVQGASGLKLRTSPLAPNGLADPAFYEASFAKTEACSGLSAPPPFIIISVLDNYNGLYYSNPSLIVINPNILVDTIHDGTETHEMIHYLLDVNTGDPDQNHASPLFMKC